MSFTKRSTHTHTEAETIELSPKWRTMETSFEEHNTGAPQSPTHTHTHNAAPLFGLNSVIGQRDATFQA